MWELMVESTRPRVLESFRKSEGSETNLIVGILEHGHGAQKVANIELYHLLLREMFVVETHQVDARLTHHRDTVKSIVI